MRGPERLGCLRGPGSKEATARAPRALCVYICISYPRVCVETAVLTTPFDGSGNPPRLFVYKAS